MVEFLKRNTAPDLAYVSIPSAKEGKNLPIVVFLGGFRSDMQGTKATYFEQQCKSRGQGYIRLDYRGHGQSAGKFEESCITEWAQDAIDVIQHCINETVILVGSSMGGWISLLLAAQNKIEISGLVGLAAAPDFTTWMEEKMSDEQKQELQKNGFFELPNDYDDNPYIISKKLIDDGRNNILLDKKLNISCPVCLIQGMKDTDVKWQVAHRIKNSILNDDVEVILLEDADHRLSAPNELELINQKIIEIS